MATHQEKPDAYVMKLKVGMRVGKMEVIEVAPNNYTVQCSCGEVLRKKKHQQIPSMCKECARVTFRDHLVPATKAADGVELRENTPSENAMIAKFLAKQKPNE